MDRQSSPVGLIPTDWKCSEVGSAFAICNTKRLPLSRERRRGMSGPFPYLGPTGVLDHINEFRYDGEFALIGEDGDHFLKFARQPMTSIASGRFNVNNHAHVIGNRDGNLVQWFQRFFEHRDITQNLTRQGAGRYKLTKATLEKLSLAIPPPAEQRAITEAIDDTAQLIDRLRRLLAKKQAIKQGMMQQLLTGRTRLPGFEDSWRESTPGTLARVTGGGTPSTGVNAYWGGDIPWFTPAEIRSSGSGLVSHSARTITAEGLARSAASLLPAGTVLVTSRASIGNCAVAAVPVTTNQGFASMIPKDPRSTWFLYYWTQQNRSEFESRAAGSTFLEISASKVSAIPLDQPSLEEQAAIGVAIRDVDDEFDALDRRLAKARAIKDGMMQQLLTGRVRLPLEAAS